MTRRSLVLVAASCLFAAAILGGLVQIGKRSTDRGPATQAAALLAARNEAIALYTIDPDNVEAQVEAVIQGATGDFLATYVGERDLLIRDVRARKQVLTAEVPTGGTAISHFDQGEAVVLVALNVTAREAGKPVTSPYRIRLTMVQAEGRWKASTLDTLEPVSAPGLAIPGRLPGGNQEITAAAGKAAEIMYAYDYLKPEEGSRAFVPLLTPTFATNFARTYAANASAAVTKQSTVDSYARAVGLVVREGDQARTLVFLDQIVETAGAIKTVPTRLFVDLKRVEGTWLVDGVAAP